MPNKHIDFKQQLKESGYKLTSQRQAILDLLIEHEGEHLSSEDIFSMLKDKHPDIGLATVYRTLMLLDRLELVYKIDLDDGCSRYEFNRHVDEHRHHHLICTKCGSVSEVEGDLLESLEEQIYERKHFIVKDHRVKFYGICEKCSAESSES